MFPLLQIVDSTAKTIANAPEVKENIELLDLFMKGGWAMIPIVILSILALVIFIERFITIYGASKIDSNFINNIREYLMSGKIDAAKSLCKNTNKPIARLVEKGIKRIGKDFDVIERAVENEAKLEMYKLEKHMNYLSIIAGIAPMVGFLGTISGVINIFFRIAQTNELIICVIAGGLYEKILTSGAGLLVGIFAFVGYNILNSMIDGVANNLEKSSVEFMDLLNEPG
jgi:biopolymer transport protein ExbB